MSMDSYTEYCKNVILDNLDYWEGQTVDLCDLGWKLTETMNVNGSCTFSRQKALDYIHEWWDAAGDYWEYENFEFGEHFHNPFDDPEAYMVSMVIAGVNALLSECDVVREGWNTCVELTEERIEKIREEVAEVNKVEL